jgi:hypothetical protein
MGSAKSDLINGIISQLKLSTAWTFIASGWLGLELGKVIWKPHDDFYPFTVLLWGAMTVVMFLGIRGGLVALTFAVPLAEADATRMKTRAVLVAGFGIACISFCFALCLVASKRVGGLYPIAAVVFGMLLPLIGSLMHGVIKRLAAFVTPLGSV